MPENVYLVGPMGAGKTTVGRRLAQLLHYEFIDTDQALEARTGVSVGHIFEVEGEAGFRRREARLLEEISESGDTVVATGGGIVLEEGNRRTMRATGTVIYLRGTLELLWQRLEGCTTRPLLNTADPREKIADLLAQRDPLYAAEADITVDICAESAARMARKIYQLLEQHENR